MRKQAKQKKKYFAARRYSKRVSIDFALILPEIFPLPNYRQPEKKTKNIFNDLLQCNDNDKIKCITR